MTVENYNDYTEVDPDGLGRTTGHVQWNADGNHLDHVAWQQSEDESRLYDDKGANHFGDFEHKVDIYWVLTSPSGNYFCTGIQWMLSNTVDDTGYHNDNNIDYLAVAFRQTSTGQNRLYAMARDGATINVDYYACSLTTWYYLVIERSTSTLTCKIYSDSSRTTLLDTLSVTCPTTQFRYIYACNTHINEAFRRIEVQIENLDLQEGAATYTKTFQIDALFQKLGIAKTFGLDAALQKRDLTGQFVTDVFFKKVGAKIFGVDAFLKKSNVTVSFAIDSIFGVVSKTKTFDLDLLLKALGFKKTFLVDAVLRKTRIVTVGLDVVLCKTGAKAFSTDVLFKGLEFKSFLIDAYFGAVGAVTYTRSFALNVVFAYKVKLPEILLDESGKIVLNISRPYVWVGD